MKFDRDGDKLVIAGAVRTPIGQAGKSLAQYESFELGHKVMDALFDRTKVDKSQVDGIVVGEIGQSSKAPNVARVLGVKAGLPLDGSAVTVANNCVSGYEALNEAARRILLGENDLMVVAGEESMTNYGYYIDNAKKNPKLGNKDKVIKNWDNLLEMEGIAIVDAVEEGLTDPVRGAMMIETAEVVAQKLGMTKEVLDEYAHGSYKKALDAIQSGKYDPFYVPVEHAKGTLDKDEFIMSKTGFVEKPERFAKATPVYDMMPGGLKEFYKKYGQYVGKDYKEDMQGAVTLFNSCPQSDGAGAFFLTTESKAKELGLEVQAKLTSWANYGVDPVYMGLGIAYSLDKAVKVSGLKWDDIDKFEIHEAFAATALGSMWVVRDELGYDLPARLAKGDVNPNGGTLALGHPLGATGVRMVINQIMDIQDGANYSLGAICAGGGVGGALILEKP